MNYRVNINQYVKVKLTQYGINELKQQRETLNNRLKNRGGAGLGGYEPKIDKYGYTKFQVWDLMQRLGGVIQLGGKPPFDTEIIMTGGECEDEEEEKADENQPSIQSNPTEQQEETETNEG